MAICASANVPEIVSIQLIDLHLYVFEDTEQDHIVYPSTDENNRKSFIHTGLGNRSRRLPDFAGFSEQHALGTGLSSIKWIGL